MSDRNSLLIGTRKGLLTLEKRNGSWTFVRESHRGIPVSYAFVDSRTDVLWASLNHGHWGAKLHRSKDKGVVWDEIEAPKYPENAEIKDGVPATLLDMWVLQQGGDDEESRLYIGTEPGGLFVSDDGGDTFELNRGLWEHESRKEHWFGGGKDHPAIHSIFVDPRDSNRVLVGISCAGVFETKDGGKTWVARNRGLKADFLPSDSVEVGHDPHLLVASKSNPDILWQQNHCGIFMSRDGGMNWIEVSENEGPARFGFCVAIDEKDPETAWVIPAESDQTRAPIGASLVVCITRDGGKTWKSLQGGLPKESCYDLVYRHALDIDGETLAFGSTNGNLYVSENAGEDWSCLSSTLPPIYSVRFA